MSKTKRKIYKQYYEKYWRLTLEYTDFKGDYFNKTLSLIVDYIDKYNGEINKQIYKELQIELNKLTPKKDLGSIRKAINQFLKLGFINNKMKSYHRKTKDFFKESDNIKKKRIYSEILYDNASFSRSYQNESDLKEINFLIKTLEYCGTLSRDNLLALMYQDISKYTDGYVDLDILENITKYVKEGGYFKRKYNQVGYLYNLCKNILSGVYINKDGNITLDIDEQIEDHKSRRVRDPYKQRLYKYDLYRESLCINKNNRIACYLEDIEYPTLIASHIKPYHICNEEEQFDPNNGLLLSKNMDNLFDQGWISFLDDGTVIYSDNLDEKIKCLLKEKRIDKKYLESPKRKEYLKYHRTNIFDKNKSKKDFFI